MSDTPRRSRTSLVALLLGAAVWVVSCENPLSPELCGTIADQTIAVGGTIDVAPCFSDPNGEALVSRHSAPIPTSPPSRSGAAR